MKLKFESDIGYQKGAIEAVCNLFQGQAKPDHNFVLTPVRMSVGVGFGEHGLSNQLLLTDEKLLGNLRTIQRNNGLELSGELGARDFTVEMETGTGKTYVYLRTIHELHQRFGFTKYVIVVPSLAIKEGVLKALQITEEHFRNLYSGVPTEYFVYDSTKARQVHNFATSDIIQIMVMTVGAINRADVNLIYSPNEKTGGEKPIDLIRATNPIVIVDEPQSVYGGLEGRGREALERMDPMCVLRYSATHVDQRNMVYRLNAVDAYQQGLVKQIEVSSARISDGSNRPYVRLVKVRRHRGSVTASIEIDVAGPEGGVVRKITTVHNGDGLGEISKFDTYRLLRIGEIRLSKPALLELRMPGDEVWIKEGDAYGDIDSDVINREMVRRTIKEHFDKEKRLLGSGIKVLSLFFIDKVDHYRMRDTDGSVQNGKFATMFEEEYMRLARDPDFSELFEGVEDLQFSSEQAHNGYFSVDSKNRWSNTSETSQANREKAERAYSLIMRDKEELLDINNPLRFIFSHSALREGWDNPNVFQICALREMRGEIERRQTLGRGLRLCVNQDGERLRDKDLNVLTVIARESYEEFATKLQYEIEEQTGLIFGKVRRDQFANLRLVGTDVVFGERQSLELWEFLREKGYLDSDERISAQLRRELRSNTVALPGEFEQFRMLILQELKRCAGGIVVKNADERLRVNTNMGVLYSSEFNELWKRIQHKTMYSVDFDDEKLLRMCADELKGSPSIQPTQLTWETAGLSVEPTRIRVELRHTTTPAGLLEGKVKLPDVLTELQNLTQLTRRSIARILQDSERLSDFKKNPRKFIEMAARVINKCKLCQVADGVKYRRMGNDEYYSQQLFETKEMFGYLRSALSVRKSVHDHVIFDSGTEREFATQLEQSQAVKVYAKLPRWFKVPTPLGSYIPDWAVVIKDGKGENVYFVAETKGTPHDLRESEAGKVAYGARHFEALRSGNHSVKYKVVSKLDELILEIQ